MHKQYIILNSNLTVEDFLALENNPLVKDIVIGDTMQNFEFKLKDYYQTNGRSMTLSGSLANIDMVEETRLLYGRMPENEFEMVVDVMVLNRMDEYNAGTLKMAGFLQFSDLLERPVTNSGLGDFIIVGIVSEKSPSIYLDKTIFINLVANVEGGGNVYYDGIYMVGDGGFKSTYTFVPGGQDGQESVQDYRYAKDIKLVKGGRLPTNDYEVLVNYDNRYDMKLKSTISYRVNNVKLRVVGYYTSPSGDNKYYVNENTVKYQQVLRSTEFAIITNDKEAAMSEFQNQGLNVIDSYSDSLNRYLENMRTSRQASLLFSGVTLAICIVEIYLIIRSSFMSRIKEVGTYRAIGMKKRDIYKMFLGEILIITGLTSFTGVGLMYYILQGTQKIPYISRMYYVSWEVGIAALIGLAAVNVLFGLLPVFQVIRNKPAAILARSDV